MIVGTIGAAGAIETANQIIAATPAPSVTPVAPGGTGTTPASASGPSAGTSATGASAGTSANQASAGTVPVAPTTPPVTTVPVVDAVATPVAPRPIISPPPITPGPVPVVDAVATPVERPPSNVTTPDEAAAAGYDPATIAGWLAAGYILSKVLVPPAIPSQPTGTFTPEAPGAQWSRKLNTGGLNPGWITATPYYSTTSPVQAQYYWGAHNPSTGTTNQWNTQVANAPQIPWGIQQGPSPLNIQQLINSQLGNPINTTPVAPVAPVAT